MRILEKATTPNGIEIQLENWSSEIYLYKFQITAYPIAKHNLMWIKQGEFRLNIYASEYVNYSNDDVKSDFEALKSGIKCLEDLSEHFWNGEKDMYLLGIIDSYEEVN